MSLVSKQQWDWLEERSTTAFLTGGILFVVNIGILLAYSSGGSEDLLLLGQGFIGLGWTAGFVGLLGLYPRLAERSKWLPRIGAVLAIVGLVALGTMAVSAFLYYADIPGGSFEDIVPVFLVGVILGCVLGFLLFGIASLRTDVYSQRLGVLLLVLPLTVVTNIARGAAGFDSAEATVVIVSVLVLVYLSIGYLLRTGTGLDGSEDVEMAGI